jgi:predicted MFS family arabinose efflux permease
MVIAGIIGNRLFDRGVRPNMRAAVIVGLIFVASLVGDSVTLNGSAKWLLIASLSVTFACIALALTAGRDQPGRSDEHAN